MNDGRLSTVDLRPWSADAVVEGRLGMGIRHGLHRVRIDGHPAVARCSHRAEASLEWELDLLEFLASNGFLVPAIMRTRDGARHVDGVVVTGWVDGRPPTSESDWDAVADELARLHELTVGWPSRPGFRSARELLTAGHGGDVDLTRMPARAVDLVRAAWERVPAAPYPVIHGDPGPPNAKLVEGRVALLNWDSTRVDSPWFDLADLPVRRLGAAEIAPARAAAHAWEAANRWCLEPAYARWRLGLLDAFRVVHAVAP